MTAQPPPSAMRLLVLRLLVLAVAAVSVFLLLASVGSADEPAPPAIHYVVQAGDTLWQIASTVTPAGGDIREALTRITQANGIVDAIIHPGQVISLPAG